MSGADLISACASIVTIIGVPLGIAYKFPCAYRRYTENIRRGLVICVALLIAAFVGAWHQGNAAVNAAAQLVPGDITDHSVSREEYATAHERFREILRTTRGIDTHFEIGIAMAVVLLVINEVNRKLAEARLEDGRAAINHVKAGGEQNAAAHSEDENV